ncbi:MAG: ABC transporter ATP-binding protein, partial [Anaerolineae bacterium]|nr:ABC transporter ATP-binding protein [Anaerolineae bacterium]
NDSVSFTLRKGEVHALLGENGAGKTTLMNIVYGLYRQDEGQVFIDGEEAHIHNPHDAINLGIGMVHQHFMLVPVFSVLENIVLGAETTRGLSLDMRSARRRIKELSTKYGLEIDPEAVVEDIPVGVQQRVEIIKALYRQANILVLDEPSAVLTPQEVHELFGIIRLLCERGVSIIFITHKLKEVLEIADRITVMRQGKVVGTTTPEESDQNTLAAMMVGRAVDLHLHKKAAEVGEVVLQIDNLKVMNDRGQAAANGISLEVREGEVLGVAGVQGNGQTELVEAITGMRSAASGKISLLGADITQATPRQVTELGSAHIPEDRQKDGLVLSYPLTDNLVLCTYYIEPFAKGIILQQDAVLASANELIEKFDIRTPNATTTAGSLSGGNQQKVIVAREFSRPIKLLVASQPTRGLDVGSIEYIHGRVIEKRDAGTAVLLVSTELDEIMDLSDRIAVVYQGQIIDIIDVQDATREKLGLMMAGVKLDDAQHAPAAANQDEESAEPKKSNGSRLTF